MVPRTIFLLFWFCGHIAPQRRSYTEAATMKPVATSLPQRRLTKKQRKSKVHPRVSYVDHAMTLRAEDVVPYPHIAEITRTWQVWPDVFQQYVQDRWLEASVRRCHPRSNNPIVLRRVMYRFMSLLIPAKTISIVCSTRDAPCRPPIPTIKVGTMKQLK